VRWADVRDLDTAGFDGVDVALVVGANDVVNPRLGIPVLEVGRARAVVVFTDSTGPGYAGIDNPVFAGATVVHGDALELLREAEQAVARIPQTGDDVTELVQLLVQARDDERD
jgi:NAD/NADP transhydrogenase beta subunit